MCVLLVLVSITLEVYRALSCTFLNINKTNSEDVDEIDMSNFTQANINRNFFL